MLIDAGAVPAFVLEGGYGQSHPEAVRAILEAVAGHREQEPVPAPSDAVRERVGRLRELHRI